jgi:hypothetical protein
MTDDFPPTNDIPPTGNSYGHYDERYAASQPTGGAVELVAIIGKHLKGRDVGCTSDELHCRAADALTAQAARIAELEVDRNEALNAAVESSEIAGEVCIKAHDATARAESAEARIAELERERDKAREHHKEMMLGYLENRKAVAERFGLEPSELQWQWRQGTRTDRSEIEWAIVDALAVGCVTAYLGDGVGCAAQIVTKQMDIAASATARAERLEAGLKHYVELFCEQPNEHSCGTFHDDFCLGCKGRTALPKG